jgi:hypothetical protein
MAGWELAVVLSMDSLLSDLGFGYVLFYALGADEIYLLLR